MGENDDLNRNLVIFAYACTAVQTVVTVAQLEPGDRLVAWLLLVICYVVVAWTLTPRN